MRPFLTAHWVDVLLVTYAVPDDKLLPHLPSGLALDRHDGKALVSVVAFDFVDTRVLGVRWPGFTTFPELNLRFYVRDEANGRRGVCFIREYVPSRIVAWLARTLYNEPYIGVPYKKEDTDHVLDVGERTHRIAWTRRGDPFVPAEDTLEHFLKEHEWGFGRRRSGEPIVYRVEHPLWRIWPYVEPHLDVSFRALYGEQWAFLKNAEPISVILAEGSRVAVFPATTRFPAH